MVGLDFSQSKLHFIKIPLPPLNPTLPPPLHHHTNNTQCIQWISTVPEGPLGDLVCQSGVLAGVDCADVVRVPNASVGTFTVLPELKTVHYQRRCIECCSLLAVCCACCTCCASCVLCALCSPLKPDFHTKFTRALPGKLLLIGCALQCACRLPSLSIFPRCTLVLP